MSSKHSEGRAATSISSPRQRLPPLFDPDDGAFQTHHEDPSCIMPVGPPAEPLSPVSSTVMIVTLSLPFQLDAQFHPRVPGEPQPHQPRLESPNRWRLPYTSDRPRGLYSVLCTHSDPRWWNGACDWTADNAPVCCYTTSTCLTHIEKCHNERAPTMAPALIAFQKNAEANVALLFLW